MNLIKNPILAGLAAFVVASAISLPTALAVSSSASSGDDGGPVTPRHVVASGTDSEFGRWQLVVSHTAKGELCRGIQLLDAPGRTGLPSLAEACGGPEVATHLGTISGANGQTLLFGRLPAATSSVSVATPNATAARQPVGTDADGAPYYVGHVSANSAQAQSLTATAVTPSGDQRVDANTE